MLRKAKILKFSLVLMVLGTVSPQVLANPSSGVPSNGATSNSVNTNGNANTNGNTNDLSNTNNNSSSAGASAGVVSTPTLLNNSSTTAGSASNSGNFGGAVRNNTNDNSGNSIGVDVLNVDAAQTITPVEANTGVAVVDSSTSPTYVVEENYSEVRDTSYNVVFPSAPGTSKNGYVFSVSTGPKGVLNYQVSCPTGGTSLGVGVLLGSFTIADNKTKLPKACKNVQSVMQDVISVKQGRDAAATLGRTFEVVLEQEIYYRTLRQLGYSDSQVDEKLRAVHTARERVAGRENRESKKVTAQQKNHPAGVEKQANATGL